VIFLQSSYPTYEEWKLKRKIKEQGYEISSYPTYEEWKLKWIFMKLLKIYVLILPMRNGNHLKILELDKTFFIVLILPMRNGNKVKSLKEVGTGFAFLSYL